jgi:rubredoxin
MCPECGSGEVTVQKYDFGICRETGYHDTGERFRCRACGAAGDAEDLVPCNSISVGSSEEALGGGWDEYTLRIAPGSKTRLTRVDAA